MRSPLSCRRSPANPFNPLLKTRPLTSDAQGAIPRDAWCEAAACGHGGDTGDSAYFGADGEAMISPCSEEPRLFQVLPRRAMAKKLIAVPRHPRNPRRSHVRVCGRRRPFKQAPRPVACKQIFGLKREVRKRSTRAQYLSPMSHLGDKDSLVENALPCEAVQSLQASKRMPARNGARKKCGFVAVTPLQ